MAVYTLHAPQDAQDPEVLAERLTTLKQGFSFAGLVFGPAWLVAHRLWRPLALWALVIAAVGFAHDRGLISADVVAAFYLLGALFVGLEGGAMREAALARRDRPLRDVAAADDHFAAEARFFDRVAQTPPIVKSASRGAPRPYAPGAIIGLFPEAGG